jgi:hypothetical protein
MRGESSETPSNALELAADAALETFMRAVEDAGGTPQQVFISAWVEGFTPDAGSAGLGFDSPADLLSFLLVQCRSLAQACGLDLQLMTMPEPKGEG